MAIVIAALQMKQYLELLDYVMKNGVDKWDRTGTWTRSIFWYLARYDLQKWFPLLTTKKMFLRWIIHELIWFLNWDTNIKYLVDNNVNIWNEWPYESYLKKNNIKLEKYSADWKKWLQDFVEKIKTDENFAKNYWELWPVYGKQRRDFNGFDQISWLIDEIKKNPNSRRLIVSAWNASEIEEMAKSGLPPCHCLFQFYVADWKLSCQLYQRSADVFLGVPFNIASYSLLTMMIAQVCDLEPWEFVHSFGDTHIYKNHFDQVKLQLSRTPKKLPTMKINPSVKDIFSFKIDDFELVDYESRPAIKAPIAV